VQDASRFFPFDTFPLFRAVSLLCAHPLCCLKKYTVNTEESPNSASSFQPLFSFFFSIFSQNQQKAVRFLISG